MDRKQLTGVGVWNGALRWGDKGEIADVAAELEQLGYTALWIPDVGGEVFEAVERLLAATQATVVATGILNLWMHAAETTASEHARLADTYGDRFLVGIGVSHPSIIDKDEPGRYARPLSAMSEYLDGLDAAPVPLPVGSRALAALGPKMLALAAQRSAGVHPYNVTPEHTAIAREALGPAGLVLPEQAVVLETDPVRAREIARGHLAHYLEMPNYANNFRRLGFGDDDLIAGGSDRIVDAIVAWGDDDAIRARIAEHHDAGADHVCIQVLTGDIRGFAREQWRELAEVLL